MFEKLEEILIYSYKIPDNFFLKNTFNIGNKNISFIFEYKFNKNICIEIYINKNDSIFIKESQIYYKEAQIDKNTINQQLKNNEFNNFINFSKKRKTNIYKDLINLHNFETNNELISVNNKGFNIVQGIDGTSFYYLHSYCEKILDIEFINILDLIVYKILKDLCNHFKDEYIQELLQTLKRYKLINYDIKLIYSNINKPEMFFKSNLYKELKLYYDFFELNSFIDLNYKI